MTYQAHDWNIGINVAGLAIVNALEVWRPGYISAAVPMAVLWVGAVVLVSVSLVVRQKSINK